MGLKRKEILYDSVIDLEYIEIVARRYFLKTIKIL